MGKRSAKGRRRGPRGGLGTAGTGPEPAAGPSTVGALAGDVDAPIAQDAADAVAPGAAATGRFTGARAAEETTSAPVLEEVRAFDVDIISGDVVAARRRTERVVVDDRVQVRGFFAGTAAEDRVRNASLEGVFVETARVLDVGDPVALIFALADGNRLHVSGRVRWVSPFGTLKDARPGMGIQLVGMRPDARHALAAHLQARRVVVE